MLGFVKIVNESIYTNREEKIREFIVNYILEEDDEDKIEDLVDSCSTFKDTKGNKKKKLGEAMYDPQKVLPRYCWNKNTHQWKL